MARTRVYGVGSREVSMKQILSALGILVLATGFSIAAGAQPQAEKDENGLTIVQTPSRTGVWGDIVYGDPNAPIELIEYASLTCPACAEFATQGMPRLLDDFVSKGQVKFVFRNFVLNQYDLAAASASRCVATTDDAKSAIDDLFKEQADWLGGDNPYLGMSEIMARHGLEQEALGQCISDQEVQLHIVQMRQRGLEEHEVNATPTFVLNGVPMPYPGYDRLRLRLETLLATQSLTGN